MFKVIILMIYFISNQLFSQQPIKAIIFDCDGTLVDSEEKHLAAWQQVALDFGWELTAEDFLPFVGNSDVKIAELMAVKLNGSPESLLFKKREYFQGYQKKGLPPITGTVAFLQKLIEQKDKYGFKIGLASAAFKEEIMLNIKALNLEGIFDVILSGEEDLKDYSDPLGVNKPQPYIYLHAAKLLGVNPSECIVIEDSLTGVSAGVSAGCLTIAVPNAFSKQHDLSKASLVMETLAHLSVEEFLEVALASREAYVNE